MNIEIIKHSFLTNPIVARIFSNPEEIFNSLVQKWNEPWRFFHTIDNHLRPMLKEIHSLPDCKLPLTILTMSHVLEIAAWFHDCVYDPKRSDNELKSSWYFRNQMSKRTESTDIIMRLILLTTNYRGLKEGIETEFAKLDLASLRDVSMMQLIQNEKALLKEFQFTDYSVYKKQRIEFLENIKEMSLVNSKTISNICDYLQQTKPKIAIYPGSFNPFHVGHLSVLMEAEKLFDKVIVAVGVNPEKKHPVHQVLDNLKAVLPYHQTELFGGFLHKYAEDKSKDADITIIRGFRSGYDIDAELINLAFMRDMSKYIKVIFIAPQKSFDYVSSSAIKQIQSFDDSECGKYLPKVYYPHNMAA